MNESTEVTLAQVEACLALFKAVGLAKDNAVYLSASGRCGEQCVDADVWGNLLDAYADVAEQWGW